jgi:hypothetical protein
LTGKTIKQVRMMCDEDSEGKRSIPNWSKWDALVLIPNPPEKYVSRPTPGDEEPASGASNGGGATAEAKRAAKITAQYAAAASSKSTGKSSSSQRKGKSLLAAAVSDVDLARFVKSTEADFAGKKRRLVLILVALLAGFGLLLMPGQPIAMGVLAVLLAGFYSSSSASSNAQLHNILTAARDAAASS